MRWAASVLLVAAACGHAESGARIAGAGREGAVDPRPIAADLAKAAGDVRWQSVVVPAWTHARTGLGLRPRDTVQTMDAATATVRFRGSGATAELGPLTTLRIPDQPPAAARLRHLSGRLVAHLPGGRASRMEVELPPGTLVLEPPSGATSERSIEARVEVDEGRTQIAMVDGTARLERTRGGDLEVDEHHFVDVRADGQVTQRGRLGARAELTSPAHDATVRTRGETRFAWSPIPGAALSRLTVRGGAGPARQVDVVAGRTSVSVTLASGTYRWCVAGLADGEPLPASVERTVTVEVDRVSPPLQIDAPTAGGTVNGGAVRVAGRTEPGAKLIVQGREVDVLASGQFSTQVPVPRGLTNVVVAAADDLGNTRVVSRAVLRE